MKDFSFSASVLVKGSLEVGVPYYPLPSIPTLGRRFYEKTKNLSVRVFMGYSIGHYIAWAFPYLAPKHGGLERRVSKH